MRQMASPEIFVLSLAFARPWMLLWLLAVAVPVGIHYLSRHRLRVIDWAATHLLRRALNEGGWRRARLAEHFLLAVRCTVIALAAIALAEPLVPGDRDGMARHQAAHHVLVFDVSYSMAYRTDGRSRLERAQQWAREMVQRNSPDTQYSVVTMGQRAVVVNDGLRRGNGELMAAIDELDVGHSSADVAAVFKSIQQRLRGGRFLRHRHAQTSVFVFTDLCATSWESISTAAGKRLGRGEAEDMPGPDLWADMASVFVCDVGDRDYSNTAVTHVRTTSGKGAIGEPVEFIASLAHFGTTAPERRVAQWWIDGAPGPRETISFDARDRIDVTLTRAFAQPGTHTVELRVDADALDLDDHRLACIPVMEKLHILCVGGKFGATHYLLRALQPEVVGEGPIAAKDIPSGSLLDQSLDAFDCIVLANVRRLRPDEIRALRGFLENGGGLIWFLGDAVDAQRYNLELASAGSGRVPIVPARLNGVVRSDRNRIDPLDFRHPLLTQFRGPGASTLSSTPVFSHVRLDVDGPAGNPQVAAEFGNGDPAIVVAPLGQGTSIIVATAASLASVDAETGRPWTVLPAWPSFLPLVQEMVKYSMLGQAERFNTLVGAPLLISTVATEDVTVVTPDGDESILTGATRSPRARFLATDRRGLYVVRRGDGSRERFAVNLDTAESDLRRSDVATLPQGIDVRSRAESRQANTTRSGHPWRANPRLLGILLGMLVLESGFAAWLMMPDPRNSAA